MCTSSSLELDNNFKLPEYSDENDEENLGVVHVSVGDLCSLQSLHLILKSEDWRVKTLCFVGVCTSRLLSLLSLLTASSIAIEFWIDDHPPLDVLVQVFQICALISICWVENRISPHGQLYFHLVHVCCVNWVSMSFANIFDPFYVFSTTGSLVVKPV